MDTEIRYLTPQDANMRLRDTICRYNGEVVFVNGAAPHPSKILLEIVLLEPPYRRIQVDSSDPLLDISSPPIGWLMFKKQPLFVSRPTIQNQKQGLCPRSVLFYSPSNGKFGNGLAWDSYDDLLAFKDAIENRGQRIAEVVSNPLGGVLGRQWALARNKKIPADFLTIYHQSIAVGTYFIQTKTFFFRKGRLTKTREMQLRDILYRPENSGDNYVISQQK